MGAPQHSTPSLDVLQVNLMLVTGALPGLVEEVSDLVEQRDLAKREVEALRQADKAARDVIGSLEAKIRTYSSATHTDEGDLAVYAGRLEHALHKRLAHPDYEYTTTDGQRKTLWDDVPKVREGEIPWERNVDYHDGFERFEYHEESYWRRLKAVEPDECPICHAEPYVIEDDVCASCGGQRRVI